MPNRSLLEAACRCVAPPSRRINSPAPPFVQLALAAPGLGLVLSEFPRSRADHFHPDRPGQPIRPGRRRPDPRAARPRPGRQNRARHGLRFGTLSSNRPDAGPRPGRATATTILGAAPSFRRHLPERERSVEQSHHLVEASTCSEKPSRLFRFGRPGVGIVLGGIKLKTQIDIQNDPIYQGRSNPNRPAPGQPRRL